MKYKEAQQLLRVNRPTICKYVKLGKIKATVQENGRLDYDTDSIYKFIGVKTRDNVIYARVSTKKQEESLKNQISILREYANKNGYKIDGEYKDIASGLHFDRGEFQDLVRRVVKGEISRVFVVHKDRLSRISFDMWKELFLHFNCEIVVLNVEEDDEKGIFEDIISMLHCFAMKMHSNRKKRKLNIIADDIQNEIDEE